MTTIRVKSVSAARSKEVDNMKVTVRKVSAEISPVELLKAFFERCSQVFADTQPYFAHISSVLAAQLEEVDNFSISGVKKSLSANTSTDFFCKAIGPNYSEWYLGKNLIFFHDDPYAYSGEHWGTIEEEGPRHVSRMAREACFVAIGALRNGTIHSLSEAASIMIQDFCRQDFNCKETFEYAYICYHGSHRRSYADISYEELVRRCDPLTSRGSYICREDLGEYISDLFK